MLDADREANVILGHPGCELFLRRELRMRGRSRMNGERASVADVGDMIEELQRVNEPGAGGLAALDLEADQAALPAAQIFLGPPLRLLPSGRKDGSPS